MENFEELYDQYVRKIYDFVYFRTFHKQTAEDLTGQVFLKALEKFGSFNENLGNFSTWLYTIARNTIIDFKRVQKITEDITLYENLTTKQNVAEEVGVKMEMEQLVNLLKNLPEDVREVVIMRAWDGLSYSEISIITEKSEASLKMAFSRAIDKLKSYVRP